MPHSLLSFFKKFGAAMLSVALSACATPPTNVHQPMSARPAPPEPVVTTPGSIYAATNSTQLFELKRARNVGDVLTILITEKIDATKKASSSAARSQTNDFGVTSLFGLPGKSFLGSSLSDSSTHNFTGKGDSNADSTFTGTITVTVIEVLPNGNLLVSGEKQIGLNQDTQFIRMSGVVDPSHIGFGNTLSSAEVADARIEYRGTGTVDSAQIVGWLSRFFLSFLPF